MTAEHKIVNTPSKEPELLNFCSMSHEEIIKLSNGTKEDREKSVVGIYKSKISKEDILKVEPMSFFEEAMTVLFLAIGVPNGVFTIPILLTLIGKFIVGDIILTFKVFGLFVLLPLTLLPQNFVASNLHCWMAVQVAKYFSFRFIYEERPATINEINDKQRPHICVAPPHGVFPYGNLLSMLVWPCLTGHHFQGLAANSALRVPIFKQILKSIGVIDASRQSARKALENYPHTVGISTGGVAEVFETNMGDECIILKERIGLIKLAIRTGADLVPCYLFGNTKLLSCWTGEGIPNGRNILEKLSRKIGFALIIFHGRWFLPIPYRIPVLGVRGKPIPTYHMKCEDPTMEQVQEIQKILIANQQAVFDDYKYIYGWEDKHLIIK